EGACVGGNLAIWPAKSLEILELAICQPGARVGKVASTPSPAVRATLPLPPPRRKSLFLSGGLPMSEQQPSGSSVPAPVAASLHAVAEVLRDPHPLSAEAREALAALVDELGNL